MPTPDDCPLPQEDWEGSAPVESPDQPALGEPGEEIVSVGGGDEAENDTCCPPPSGTSWQEIGPFVGLLVDEIPLFEGVTESLPGVLYWGIAFGLEPICREKFRLRVEAWGMGGGPWQPTQTGPLPPAGTPFQLGGGGGGGYARRDYTGDELIEIFGESAFLFTTWLLWSADRKTFDIEVRLAGNTSIGEAVVVRAAGGSPPEPVVAAGTYGSAYFAWAGNPAYDNTWAGAGSPRMPTSSSLLDTLVPAVVRGGKGARVEDCVGDVVHGGGDGNDGQLVVGEVRCIEMPTSVDDPDYYESFVYRHRYRYPDGTFADSFSSTYLGLGYNWLDHPPWIVIEDELGLGYESYFGHVYGGGGGSGGEADDGGGGFSVGGGDGGGAGGPGGGRGGHGFGYDEVAGEYYDTNGQTPGGGVGGGGTYGGTGGGAALRFTWQRDGITEINGLGGKVEIRGADGITIEGSIESGSIIIRGQDLTVPVPPVYGGSGIDSSGAAAGHTFVASGDGAIGTEQRPAVLSGAGYPSDADGYADDVYWDTSTNRWYRKV